MLVVDVETSGVDPNKSSLLSIGAVDFENSERQFYGECKAWDGAHLMEEAMAVNGFTKEDVTAQDKKPLEVLMYEFKKWIDDGTGKTLAGQNPAFDRDFLNDSFHRANIDFKFAIRNVDLHSVAYYDHIKRGIKIPLKNMHSDLSLDKIARYAGLTEEPKPHNALNGAKFEAEAFSRIMYGKQLLPEFESYIIPKHLKT
jgi:DNA polymerase-3 subunit epsilon